MSCKFRLARWTHVALKTMTAKTEIVTYFFAENDEVTVIELNENVAEDNTSIACFECEIELFLFVQICAGCEYLTTTFCINHYRSATKTYNVPDHSGKIFCKFYECSVSTVVM